MTYFDVWWQDTGEFIAQGIPKKELARAAFEAGAEAVKDQFQVDKFLDGNETEEVEQAQRQLSTAHFDHNY